jgi:integrase
MADIRKRTGAKGTTYQVRYPSKSTKTGYAFKTFSKLKEARLFLENSGSLSDRPQTHIRTVAQAVELWLDICEKIGRDGRETVEPATLVEYRRRGKVMQEYLWDKELCELEPSDIVRFRDWMLRNKSRDLARRTLSSFHSIVIEMMHQGHIRHDPAANITIKSGGRYESADTEIEIPSDDEMRAILGAADALGAKNEQLRKTWLRYRPMIYLACFSGMRPSEYRGLTWANVYSDHVCVTQRADIKGVIGPVKSKAGRRKIYLPMLVMEMLSDWKEHCPASRDDLVFPTASGRPQLLGRFRKSGWVPLLREAGLLVPKSNDSDVLKPKYTLYALRHYYASKLIEQKCDLKFIQETMGHSKIETTLDVYAHLMKDREDVRIGVAETLATDLLKNPCGKFVASDL